MFGPNLPTIPSEDAPEEKSQPEKDLRDAARRGGRIERADVGDAASVAAARKIHDRDVVQRDVAQQLVRAKAETQILVGGAQDSPAIRPTRTAKRTSPVRSLMPRRFIN